MAKKHQPPPHKKKGPPYNFQKKNLNPKMPKGLAPSFKIMSEALKTKTVR